jgi:hypothetical protein
VSGSTNTDTQRKQDLQTLSTALNAYYQKHGTFNVAGAGAGGSGAGLVSKDGPPQYKTIEQALYEDGDLVANTSMPTTPSNANDYYMLYSCNAGQSFALSAKLDNPSSSDIANIQTTCNGSGGNGTYTTYGRNYAVAGTPPNTDAQRKQDLQTLTNALRSYYKKHGTFKVAGAGAGGGGNGVVSTDGTTSIIQGLYADGDLSSNTTLPAAPSSGSDYYLLYVCDSGQSFALSSKLDNPSSSDIANIQTTCNGTGANGTYSLYGRNYAVSGTPPYLWPLIYGQSGSYFASTVQDLADMDALGMHLIISSPGGAPYSAFAAHHAKAITNDIDAIVVHTLCPSGTSCNVTQSGVDSVLSQTQSYLTSVANDPNIVGFWILDDYPGGDIHTVLQQVHALVVQANATSIVQRATVCGVGVDVTLLGAQTTRDYGPTLSNVTSAGCDIVGIYAYGHEEHGTDPAQFDWSMSIMLPDLLARLRAIGWDTTTKPVIGLPQAFRVPGYVMPRRADVAQQTAAFCNAGAVAITAFSWDTSAVGAGAGLVGAQEPYNNADIRQGLIDGLQQCRSVWSATLAR